MLSEDRLNSLYRMVGEQPPIHLPSFSERLECDVFFIQAIEALLSIGNVDEEAFNEVVREEVSAVFGEQSITESQLKELWNAIKKAAHHVGKALKKTVGTFVAVTPSGGHKPQGRGMSNPQRQFIQAAVKRAHAQHTATRRQGTQRKAG